MTRLALPRPRRARMADRYEAAIRLEKIRQQLREAARYGFTVTLPMANEVREAEAEYDAATALLP